MNKKESKNHYTWNPKYRYTWQIQVFGSPISLYNFQFQRAQLRFRNKGTDSRESYALDRPKLCNSFALQLHLFVCLSVGPRKSMLSCPGNASIQKTTQALFPPLANLNLEKGGC